MDEQKNLSISVDTIIEKHGKILLITRGQEPFKGKLGFPGGRVNYGETVEAAAARESKEETGLNINLKAILGVYSDPNRDPRGYNVAVVFVADTLSGEPQAGDDAAEAKFYSLAELDISKMSFDHAKILKDYLNWKRKGSTYWSSKQ